MPLLLERVLRVCRGPAVRLVSGSLSLIVGVDMFHLSLAIVLEFRFVQLSWLVVLNLIVSIHLVVD